MSRSQRGNRTAGDRAAAILFVTLAAAGCARDGLPASFPDAGLPTDSGPRPPDPSFAAPAMTLLDFQPTCLAFAKLTEGGPMDAVVGRNGGGVMALLGDSNGGFRQGPSVDFAATPYDVAVARMAPDLPLELIAVLAETDQVTIVPTDGVGGFGAVASYSVNHWPLRVALADLNRDGFLDIAATTQGNSDVSVLVNNGRNIFAAATGSALGQGTVDVAAVDVNGDGLVDLAAIQASPDGQLVVLLGNGDGTFGPPTMIAPGSGESALAVAPFRSGSRGDIALARTIGPSHGVEILLAESHGLRDDATYSLTEPRWIAAADFNGDGNMDVATFDRYHQAIDVLNGDGTGRFYGSTTSFDAGTTLPGFDRGDHGVETNGITIADVNGDGLPDIGFVGIDTVSVKGSLTILLNTSRAH